MKFLGTLLSFLILTGLQGQSTFHTVKDQMVPSFELATIDNDTFNIEDFKGKVTLLAFFGTRCPPCLRELPEVQAQLVDKHNKDKFQVIAIAATDNQSRLIDFRTKKDFDFIYVPDNRKKIFSLFAESSLPRTVVLDPTGKIIYQAYGYYKRPFDKMVKLIDEEVNKL